MNNEILAVLEYMEKEKGIGRQDMIATIASAIRNAAQKGINAGQQLRIEIDPRNGTLKAWAQLRVVDSVSDPAVEIHFEKAQRMDPESTIGSIVEKEVDLSQLGRIAAQTAMQGIKQKIREFEKNLIYKDYQGLVGDIVTGTVRRRERGDLIVDLGRAEAILPPRERVPGEDYSPGERIRCLLQAIENTPRGPELVLSRSSIRFVRRLFELEVTEIADGTVTIESMAREPGYRTKIAVNSVDTRVDPVGACVGARGARVKSIVRELGGEKIDIIRFHPDPARMLEEAIRPAVPRNLKVDEKNRRLYFEVSEEDLSVAIGRKGQNARLTSRLMGWRLDIGREKKGGYGFDQRLQRAVQGLNAITGITDAQAQQLVAMGITTPDAFEGVTMDDLVGGGFTNEDATQIIQSVEQFRRTQGTPA